MSKILLIGGYPKGYSIPFHPKTKSGKILRKFLYELNIEATPLNLWKNADEEKLKLISKKIISKIQTYHKEGYSIVALGKYQEKALLMNYLDCLYLPHPASRRKIDLDKLKAGLLSLKTSNSLPL